MSENIGSKSKRIISAFLFFSLSLIVFQANLFAQAAPTNLDANVLSSTKVYLIWDYAIDEDTVFYPERSIDHGITYEYLAEVPANTRYYLVKWLRPGVEYRFRVKAVRNGSSSAYSNIETVNMPTGNDPENPFPSEIDTANPLIHKNPYAVTGSNFGEKAQALPLKWDDFENALEDNPETPEKDDFIGMEPENGWYAGSSHGYPPEYSLEKPRGLGSVSVKQNYFAETQYNCNFGLHVPNADPENLPDGGSEFFISFYRYAYTQTGPDTSRNYKILSLRAGNASDWSADGPRHQFRHDIYPYTEGSGHTYLGNCDGEGIGDVWANTFDLNQNRWERFDYYIQLGSVGNTDGYYQRWLDGKWKVGSGDGMVRNYECLKLTNIYFNGFWARDRTTCIDEGPYYGDYCFGCDIEGENYPCDNTDQCGGGTCDNSSIGCQMHGGCWAYFWVDDAYIDITQARVEVCDVSRWSERDHYGSHCEIQIPTAWSQNSISFIANQGSFDNDEPLFLYVVDSEGDVNEEGISLTFNTPINDTIPPYRFNGQPTGTLPASTIGVTLSLNTNENANCKYSTSAGVAYDSMPNTFSVTGGNSHSQEINGLTQGDNRDYYVKCADTATPDPNINHDDYEISFSINVQDTEPPAVIEDLSVSCETAYSCELTWTATGDDGDTGTAAEYDIRYSLNTIDESSWDAAIEVSGTLPVPEVSGSSESFTVEGLDPETDYYFAIKTADNENNWSAISGDVLGHTQPGSDISPPRISNIKPDTSLNPGTKQTYISFQTSEEASCRYSLISDIDYQSMSNSFDTGISSLYHSVLISGLDDGSYYRYYIKCRDLSGNINEEDYLITVHVLEDIDINPEENSSSNGTIVKGGGCSFVKTNITDKFNFILSLTILILLTFLMFAKQKYKGI